jgi:uncharacterized membrane protein SirB2
MPYAFYSFLHIWSLIIAIVALGGIVFHMIQGGTKENLKIRKQLMIIHGVGLLFAFVAGFGLMAKGGFSFSTAQWLYVKIACWLVLGAFPVLVFKKILPKWMGLIGLFFVVGLAVFTVAYKPF